VGTRRPPWNVYPPSSGPGSGLYRSNDGGRTFARVAGTGCRTIPGASARHRAERASRVYAMIDAAKGGLYRSDDDGATWSRASDDPRIWARWYFARITVIPAAPT